MLTQVIRLSIFYFVLVFMAGAVLGSLRIPFLQPYLGQRYAELLEMPVMMAVIWQAAQFTTWEIVEDPNGIWSFAAPLLVGIFALLWLLATELATTALISGFWNVFTVYFYERDYIAGPIYGLALLSFAIMPLVIRLRQKPSDLAWKWTIDIDDKVGEQDEYCSI